MMRLRSSAALGDAARIPLLNSSFRSDLLSSFLTTVKSRINGRIRRNSNRIFILYNDRGFIEIGFVRHISR